MRYSTTVARWSVLLLVLGCATATQKESVKPDETAVRTAFTTLQKALQAKDAEQIWDLLDPDSQKNAEGAAKAWQEALAKADADKVKKDLGITPDELAKLDGKGFLKTDAFYEKEIKELMEAKQIEEVKPPDKGRSRVSFLAPGGEKDYIDFVRQKDGKWKVLLPMEGPKS